MIARFAVLAAAAALVAASPARAQEAAGLDGMNRYSLAVMKFVFCSERVLDRYKKPMLPGHVQQFKDVFDLRGHIVGRVVDECRAEFKEAQDGMLVAGGLSGAEAHAFEQGLWVYILTAASKTAVGQFERSK